MGWLNRCSEFAEFAEYEVKPTLYTYSEIRTITEDFHPDMKLGEGHYGAVYKVCASFRRI